MVVTPNSDAEWFIPDSSIAVRQGDILICREPTSGHIEEICLVVTADCDISKGKFGRQLACLRIAALDEYVSTIWAEKKLRKILRDETDKIRGQVAKWHTKQLGVESVLTTSGAIAWLQRESPESMSESLNIPVGEREKFVTAISTYRTALEKYEATGTKSELAQLISFKATLRGQNEDACHQELLQQAQREELPEDVFLLPSLPQLEIRGAVVLLRELFGIPYESVCYRTADAQSSDAFLRIGRLQPAFKYAISQAFGVLYSRIGLPADYEARCKDTIQNITSYARE